MCTLSFAPTRNGFVAAMNRDESLAREIANPPQIFSLPNTLAVYPSETSGGTWIGANDRGLLLALLNKNVDPGSKKQQSRGTLIPNLVAAHSLAEVEGRLRSTKIAGMLPFRLIAFDVRVRSIRQMTWQQSALAIRSIPWAPRHWFSSSLSDMGATTARGRTCALFTKHSVLTAGNVRELHRSHSPSDGPFSICVHRPGVGTVSYTEIEIIGDTAVFSYAAGHPCQWPFLQSVQLCLADRRSPVA